MTTNALSSALSGLRVAQQGLDVTALNVANAGTEGYTRKILPQTSLVIGNTGVGVVSGAVQRYMNESLQRDYRTQLSTETYLSTRENILARIQAAHGAPELQANVAARLGQLNNKLVELSSAPESRPLQLAVIDSAKSVARTINNFGETLLSLRRETEAGIESAVTAINYKLSDVADLNRRIASLQATGQETAALEDQRDLALKGITEEMTITYYKDGDGILVVQDSIGRILADDTAHKLSFSISPMGSESRYPYNLNGVVLDENNSNNAIDLAANPAALGGRLGALLVLRDQELPIQQVQLDELAHKIALRFDAQGLKLFTNGQDVVANDVANQYVGFSRDIQINSSILSDPSLVQKGTGVTTPSAGSNEVIKRVLDYALGRFADDTGTLHPPFRTQNLGAFSDINLPQIADDTSLLQFATQMVDAQAAEHSLVKASLDTEQQYTKDIEQRFANDVGVDMDIEMARMIELQRNYSASAKMVTAMQQLFDELLNAF